MVGNLISGSDVARQLERARRDARRRAEDVRAGLDKLDDFIKQLIAQRGNSLVELAQHYFPDLSQTSIEKQFAEVRGHLKHLLEQKQRREAELHQTWDTCLDRRADLDQQIEQVTEKLDKLANRRDELEQQLAQRLREHAEFEPLSQQTLAAETELKRNELRVAEMRDEVAEKLPAYEKSRLFQYLYRRGYGTAEYRGKGWTQQLDRWVAKIVKYNKNRQSYNFLKVTPELMANEVERRREDFNKLMQRLEAIEDSISDEIGLTDVLQQGTQRGDEREALMKSVSEVDAQRDQAEQELARLEVTENEYYEAGVNRLKEFLGNMEESALEFRTRVTPQTTDDEIFREIKDCNAQLREARQQNRDDREQLQLWNQKLSGLDQVVSRFRMHEFDSRRSWFSPQMNLSREVDRFLQGQNTPAGLWSTLSRYQQFIQPQLDNGWNDPTGVFDQDVSRVLGRVLVDVAGEALRQAAQRGMHRRGPTRARTRSSRGRPPYRRGGGFTTGRGF